MRGLIASLAVMIALAVAMPTPAWAQGNVGGTIGKKDKTVTGGDQPPPKKAPRPRAAPSATKIGGCGRSLVGSWSGTAGLGVIVLTFNADGSASTNNGFTGRWKCDGGAYLITWHTGSTTTLRVSSDGKTFTGTSGVFSVGFTGTRQ